MTNNANKTLKIGDQIITYAEAVTVICYYCHRFIDEDENDGNENNFEEIGRCVRSMREQLGEKDDLHVKELIDRAYGVYVEDLGIEKDEFLICTGLTESELYDSLDCPAIDEDEAEE